MRTALYPLVAALTAVCCGCTTPTRERIPLGGPERTYITNRAQPPDRLKIGVEVSNQGEIAFDNVRNVPLGMAGAFALHESESQRPAPATATVKLSTASLPALIETASPYTLVDFATAQLAGIIPLNYQQTNDDESVQDILLEHVSPSPSGPVFKFLSYSRNITLGDIRIYNVPVGIVDDTRGLDTLWWLDRGMAQLLVGYDVLSTFDFVTIDLAARRIAAGSGRYHPEPSRLAAAVPLVKRTRVPMVEAHIEGKGPYRLALSTGGDFGLWLPRHMAEEMEITEALNYEPPEKPSRRKLPPATIPAAARAINVSGFELAAVPTTVSILDTGDEGAAYGLLGNHVLRNYVTTIDKKAGKVYFERP